jgi:TadE-like protein
MNRRACGAAWQAARRLSTAATGPISNRPQVGNLPHIHRRRGGALLESAMFLPIVLALLIGTVELARVTYTYYMLQKMMFNLARYLGTQQGVNFCDGQDATVQAAINYALTGSNGTPDNPIVGGLTPGMFQVSTERFDPNGQQLVACDCSATGCDASQGGLPPGFIVVSLTDGYPVRPLFWGFSVSSFALRPTVRVPYGGT